MDKKPNVFPDGKSLADAMREANETGTKIAEQANKELELNPNQFHKSKGELEAEAEMKRNTLNLMDAQIKAMDELLAKKQAEKTKTRPETIKTEVIYDDEVKPSPIIKETPKIDNISTVIDEIKEESTINLDKYAYLSKKEENVPYDIIQLPSDGLLYKNHKGSLKVSYLNAMDESIMTNPNLLQTGKFLEILFNRKMLDTDLKYTDLHVGDRNAIMIWLRSTGYGPIYNITLSNPKDPNYEEFNVDVDLSKLKMKKLGAKPDENGYFDFTLPVTGTPIKFKLLTIGELDIIEDYVRKMNETLEFNDGSPFALKMQIMEVNGVSDRNVTEPFAEKMRIGDIVALRKYINKIESGVDMNITVGTPGGGSLNTFLPLNLTFFWPDIRV